MTVQLPVLLWTAICFLCLMLILDRLLFRPLLAFMDKREERIRRAEEKKEADGRTLSEAEAALALFREQEAAHAAALAEEALAAARREADGLVADACGRQKQTLEEYRSRLTGESADIAAQLEEDAETLAKAYLSALTR